MSSKTRVYGLGANVFARPKSSTFTLPSGVILHIRGLQIAVHDAFLVRRFQRICNLRGNPERLLKRYRTSLNPIGQRFARNEFHHQKLRPPDSSSP